MLEYLRKIILRFKDSEITNLETYDDYGYLDFIYKNVNMSVWNVSYEYIVDDYLSLDDYAKMLNTDKETELQNAIVDLKYYENSKYTELYNSKRDEIIEFLKENW